MLLFFSRFVCTTIPDTTSIQVKVNTRYFVPVLFTQHTDKLSNNIRTCSHRILACCTTIPFTRSLGHRRFTCYPPRWPHTAQYVEASHQCPTPQKNLREELPSLLGEAGLASCKDHQRRAADGQRYYPTLLRSRFRILLMILVSRR